MHKVQNLSTSVTPKYPLQEFVVWAEDIDRNVLLSYLDDIQQELDEELLLAVLGNSMKGQGSYQALHSYWCLYCAQIRKYYQAMVRHPCCKSALSFLLVNSLPDRPQR
ncbi:MAG: hypothetical protein B0W54_11820 [Cellvibrio sp. 79]|nr:MAG: hypothetical protein B0W54_11820 [Cellvibrio sp. 79]